ncbi:uncharacterized protein LOC115223092 [Octopus sinensis]|uniref:Uncharacterized protein LOC115223092 n=1 Tax=Octopus sinensis TaxID=2607531 RepID=A0A6P7TJT9_9MOLL|nr:uncharacterized protein LOC115223092 [Octopus sinensis]
MGSHEVLVLQGKGAAEIHGEMKEVLKDGCSSFSMVKILLSRFQTGHFEVIVERPTSATTENKADAVHVKILKDHRSSPKVIDETPGISCKRIGHIIPNILDKRKLSAKWVLDCLNTGQKRIRVTTSKVTLDWFAAGEADFMARLVTMGETWLHK